MNIYGYRFYFRNGIYILLWRIRNDVSVQIYTRILGTHMSSTGHVRSVHTYEPYGDVLLFMCLLQMIKGRKIVKFLWKIGKVFWSFFFYIMSLCAPNTFACITQYLQWTIRLYDCIAFECASVQIKVYKTSNTYDRNFSLAVQILCLPETRIYQNWHTFYGNRYFQYIFLLSVNNVR